MVRTLVEAFVKSLLSYENVFTAFAKIKINAYDISMKKDFFIILKPTFR